MDTGAGAALPPVKLAGSKPSSGSQTPVNMPGATRPPLDAVALEKAVREARAQQTTKAALDAVQKGKERAKQEVIDIGRREAVAAARSGPAPPPSSMKSARPVAPEVGSDSASRMINQLNGYRKTYDGKIDFQFQPYYHSGMPAEYLSRELQSVRLCVNSNNVLGFLKESLKSLVAGIHKLHVEFGQADAVERRINLASAFSDAVDKGHVDPEMEQLAIDYSHYLAVGPEMRLAGKVFNFYKAVRDQNLGIDPISAARANANFDDV